MKDKTRLKKFQNIPERLKVIADVMIFRQFVLHNYITEFMPDFYEMATQLEAIKRYPKQAMDYK